MVWLERQFNYRNKTSSNPIWIILNEFVEQEKSEVVFLLCSVFPAYLRLVWRWLESVVQRRALLPLSVLCSQTVLMSFSRGLSLGCLLASNSGKVAQNTQTGEIPETRTSVNSGWCMATEEAITVRVFWLAMWPRITLSLVHFDREMESERRVGTQFPMFCFGIDCID